MNYKRYCDKRYFFLSIFSDSLNMITAFSLEEFSLLSIHFYVETITEIHTSTVSVQTIWQGFRQNYWWVKAEIFYKSHIDIYNNWIKSHVLPLLLTDYLCEKLNLLKQPFLWWKWSNCFHCFSFWIKLPLSEEAYLKKY